MEENVPNPSPVTMILYTIDNDKKNPTQNWEIIPKKKYIIGRSKKEVDIALNLKLLSRKHAELIYYDNKTIMIKDLNSRNGTFINKIKIDPLKETFFTNKEPLSFGNLNNEIVFFDNNEQPKEEIPQTDSEKSKNSDSDNEKEEKSEQKIDINNKEIDNKYKKEIFEEINTNIKQNIQEEKEKYSLNNQKREIESTSGKRIFEEKKNSNSKEQSRQRELNREQIKDKSISNKAIYDDRKPNSHINSSNNNIYMDRSDAHRYTDKSYSRENRNTSRSRSGSIETLVQQYKRNQRNDDLRINQEISFKNDINKNNSQRNEIESERERETYREREKERERERERSRRDSNERSYRDKIERDIEEDKYMMRKRYEEMRRRENKEREKYNDRRERERDRYYNDRRERDRYYNERRRESDNNTYNKYFEEGNKIILKPEKLDIVMNQNFEKPRNNNDDNKEGDMGYIKCYVEGYMYLKIRRNENN